MGGDPKWQNNGRNEKGCGLQNIGGKERAERLEESHAAKDTLWGTTECFKNVFAGREKNRKHS